MREKAEREWRKGRGEEEKEGKMERGEEERRKRGKGKARRAGLERVCWCHCCLVWQTNRSLESICCDIYCSRTSMGCCLFLMEGGYSVNTRSYDRQQGKTGQWLGQSASKES